MNEVFVYNNVGAGKGREKVGHGFFFCFVFVLFLFCFLGEGEGEGDYGDLCDSCLCFRRLSRMLSGENGGIDKAVLECPKCSGAK